ncbi:unnamed protein product, partial [Prorocentrum cordatum]
PHQDRGERTRERAPSGSGRALFATPSSGRAGIRAMEPEPARPARPARLRLCAVAALVALAGLHGAPPAWCQARAWRPARQASPVTVRAAAMPDMGKLMGAMPKMMEGMKKLPELQAKLKATPCTGEALNGRIKVTITGDLTPQAVEIEDALLKEVDGKTLSLGVLAAMQNAHANSVQMSQKQLSEFYGSMGVPIPGGAPAPAPAPPPPSLDFDPIGIRSLD